ncbi:ABC transporter permease subunit [Microbacter sp. ANSKLAB05]|nr:ABC transporter permease subunit [Microbacter sp. ANSKLAB05]
MAWRAAGPLRRLFVLLSTLVLVSIVTFGLLEISEGKPVDALLPEGATDEERAAVEAAYGLDGPVVARYLAWFGNAVTGDLGRSLANRAPVWDEMAARLPVTLELAVLSTLLALVIALPIAVWSGYRPGGVVDRVSGALVSVTMAIPSFLLGLLLVFVFGVTLQAFPVSGWMPLSDGFAAHYSRLVLPVITLAASQGVLFIRVLRGDIAATIGEDFILAARARGIRTPAILIRHAFRPSAFALLTVLGLSLGQLIGGTVIVEQLFGLPGMGQAIIAAINGRDIFVVQGAVLLVAVGYVLINTLVDLAYPLLDPRVRS